MNYITIKCHSDIYNCFLKDLESAEPFISLRLRQLHLRNVELYGEDCFFIVFREPIASNKVRDELNELFCKYAVIELSDFEIQ